MTTARSTAKKPPAAKASKPAPKVTAEKEKTIKVIDTVIVVAYKKQSEFVQQLKNEISKIQECGYEADVQYSCSGETFTALLLGRKERGVK